MTVWRWLAGRPWLVTFALIVGGNVVGWRTIEAERSDREADSCATALASRAEQRDMWVDVLRQAGVDEPTIDILRDGFAGLPDPASCGG